MADETRRMLKRLLIAVAFGVAFGYIESAVVVYLREIFHPHGFTFPLAAFDVTPAGRRLLLTEVGREAATLVLILTAAWLFGHSGRERVAYFLAIFAVWDVFYYVWLKVLLDWPASLLAWDILFLIPVVWAAPILYPILVSLGMLAFATALLHRSARGRPLTVTYGHGLGWLASILILVVSFCLGGSHASQPDYAEHFHWPLFAAGYALGAATCASCLRKPRARERAQASVA